MAWVPVTPRLASPTPPLFLEQKMNNLEVFKQATMNSQDIAVLVESRHDNVRVSI